MTSVYVDPQSIHNPAAGTKPPATWGDTVRDDIVTLATPPGCRAARVSTQSVSDSTYTAVQFDAADDWDTDGFHSPTVNNTRITIPTGFGGRYHIEASAVFAANATGYRAISVMVNGSTTIASTTLGNTGASLDSTLTASVETSLAAASYVELIVWQSSGGALNVGSAAFLTWMTVRLVSW